MSQRLIVFSLTILNPGHAIEIGTVIGVELKRPFDCVLRFVQVNILFGPHVAEIVVGLGGVGRVHRNGLAKKIGSFVI